MLFICLLRSSYLPCKRFLEKNTQNSKVNNWAVKIEQYQIKFEYIKDMKNTLADTMSRRITIDPDICQDPEPEGEEYGYCVFEEVPIISTIRKVPPKTYITLNEITASSGGLLYKLEVKYDK